MIGLSEPDLGVGRGSKTQPPKGAKAQLVFDILKWKSREMGLEPLLKWRDVVSFAGDLLRPWTRYIGRCLQLLIQELGGLGQGLGSKICRGYATKSRPSADSRKIASTTSAHRPPWKWTWRTCFGRSPKRRSQRPWIRPCPLYGEKRGFNGFACVGGGEET